MKPDSNIFSKLPVHFLIAFVFAGAGVATNLLGIRFPNDGAYYVAVADSLIASGNLRDLTVAPSEPLITHQNGIVYFIAALKLALGWAWWTGYIICVAFLWALTSKALFHFFSKIIKGAFSTESTFLAVLLCYVPLVHYTSMSVIGSFYNEAIIVPLIWVFYVWYANKFGNLSRGGGNLVVADPKGYLRIGLLIAFVLVFGMFFRVQSLTFITAAVGSLLIFRALSIRMALVMLATPLAVFWLYILGNPAPFSDALLNDAAVIDSSILIDRIFRVFSLMASPISLISAATPAEFLQPYKINNVILIGASLVSLYGLSILKKQQPGLFVFTLLLLIFNSVFVLLLPIYTPRYDHLMTVPILTLYLYALCGLRQVVSVRQINLGAGAAAILVVALMSVYASIYFENRTSRKTYMHISAAEELASIGGEMGPFVIYSQLPRLTYWHTGWSSCTVEPVTCMQIQGLPESSSIIYVGHHDFFANLSHMEGYVLEEQLSVGEGIYKVWNVAPIVVDED